MNNDQATMTNDKVQCVILAAGQGTRMKSEKPKVLHPIVGKPMVQYAIEAANSIGSQRPIVVIGHGAEQVKQAIGDHVDYVLQSPQRGTGHALLEARAQIDPASETVLVLYGDTPFIGAETLQRLLAAHRDNRAVVSLITFTPSDQAYYCTVVAVRGE
jgi:bifunctional UDP-N-acetylglucosamine pyrophosphorylase / glucosamine-1-phosphate N-acetyltransferase